MPSSARGLSCEAPAVERARVLRDDPEGEIARAEYAQRQERLGGARQRPAAQARHGGEPLRGGPGGGRQPDDAAGQPEREVAALPVHGPGEDRHLRPEAIAAGARHGLGVSCRDVPSRHRGGGAAASQRLLPELPGERERERATVADHPMRSPWLHVEERAGLEVLSPPPAPDHGLVEVLARARTSTRPRRHGPPAFELHPYRFDVAVVMKAQPLPAPAIDDEEEGGLLAPGPE